jgi:glutathione S-transferase
MITVHHLNDSRSQRILWLLEELGLAYEIKRYQRDATTRLAPDDLKAIHPLGKSPAITDEGRAVIESGAIIDYILRRHAPTSPLQPDPAGAAYDDYAQWLHYAEGSAMLPLMLNMYVMRLGDAGAPLHPRIESEMANHLGYVNGALEGREWLVGAGLTGADIQMSFIGEVAGAFGRLPRYPAIEAWVKRFQARPAYKTALEKGGAYSFAR